MTRPSPRSSIHHAVLALLGADAQVRLDGIVRDRVGKINELLKGTQHVITPQPARVVP